MTAMSLQSPAKFGRVTRAYVNRGRWIVECECREAREAQPGVKQWSCSCSSQYSILWPSDTTRRKIEGLLAQRPPQNQNWWPWETIETLIAENLEHGCPASTGGVD